MAHPIDFLYGKNDRERLTKREYFAAMAMQGLLTVVSEDCSFQDVAKAAAMAADCLIEQLNKKPEDRKETNVEP